MTSCGLARVDTDDKPPPGASPVPWMNMDYGPGYEQISTTSYCGSLDHWAPSQVPRLMVNWIPMIDVPLWIFG